MVMSCQIAEQLNPNQAQKKVFPWNVFSAIPGLDCEEEYYLQRSH